MFLDFSSKIPEEYLTQATTASFQILSNSSLETTTTTTFKHLKARVSRYKGTYQTEQNYALNVTEYADTRQAMYV